MENQQSSPLFGRNIFSDAFEEFNEEQFFADLHHRVQNKSFFHRYRGFKTTILWLSYLFNTASALTASYAVYWLAQKVIGVETVSLMIACLFLFFLEKIKRKSSGEFWQVLFFRRKVAAGWLALSLLCFAVSLASSGFGVKEGTEDLGPSAELLARDSTAQDYRNQIATLQSDNERLEKQRNLQGEIYWPAQQEKKKNKELIAALQLRIIDLDLKLDGHNEELSASHQQDIELTAQTLVWITILMELLFECCIAWIWYYFYRAYVERQKIDPLAPGSPSPTLSTPSLDLDALADAVAKKIPNLTPASPPASQPPNLNGHEVTQSVQTNLPIGFYTQEQRANQEMARQTPDASLSVQTCTDVYRVEVPGHVIIHEYEKGGRVIRTPYTRNQVVARISQYQRDIEAADQQQLSETVKANRLRWLRYWQGRLRELDEKLVAVNL